MTEPKQWALITGASGGIGAEIARVLAEKGYSTILVARGEEQLNKVAKTIEQETSQATEVIVMDMAEPDSARALYDRVFERDIAILVNNAGFGFLGTFMKSDWPHYFRMMQLNMQTLVHLTYLFLPDFRKKEKSAYIMNVGSVAGWQGVPYFSLYAATKAFVNNFSEGLAWELEKTNVSVTALQPGKTQTGFFAASGVKEGHESFTRKGIMSARKVAVLGVAGMFKRKPMVITGVLNKISVLLSRWTPRPILKQTLKVVFRTFSK